MKSSVTRYTVVFIMVLVALAGCKARENSESGGATETIAPAKPQPAATGSDAMTQTVDVEDSRSEAEGAALNKPGMATDTTATTTAAPTTTTPPTSTTTTR